MSETMIDRVGKAILEESKNLGPIAHYPTGDYSIERRLARAAIEAMREEATLPMDTALIRYLNKCGISLKPGDPVPTIAALWPLLIDAALSKTSGD